MSDIFVSYAGVDRERARAIADAFAERGWSVWWDREIPFGESFDRVIERELALARSVIVLWSRASVESDWVRNEARRGLKRDALLPVQIEAAELPLEFSAVQTADLTDWMPGAPHAAFDRLIRRLQTKLGTTNQTARAVAAAATPPAPLPPSLSAPRRTELPTHEEPLAPSRNRTLRLVGALAIAALLVGGGFFAFAPSSGSLFRDDAGGAVVSEPARETLPAEVRPSPARTRPAASSAQTPPAASPGRALASPIPGAASPNPAVTSPNPAVQSIIVPNVVGLELPAAEATLRALGLRIGRVTTAGFRTDPSVKEPTVRRHSPSGGSTAAMGSLIDLDVAAPMVVVPNLSGRQMNEVPALLAEAGLTLGKVTEREDATASAGSVLAQQPAGQLVGRGQSVDVVVAKKPTAPMAPRNLRIN